MPGKFIKFLIALIAISTQLNDIYYLVAGSFSYQEIFYLYLTTMIASYILTLFLLIAEYKDDLVILRALVVWLRFDLCFNDSILSNRIFFIERTEIQELQNTFRNINLIFESYSHLGLQLLNIYYLPRESDFHCRFTLGIIILGILVFSIQKFSNPINRKSNSTKQSLYLLICLIPILLFRFCILDSNYHNYNLIHDSFSLSNINPSLLKQNPQNNTGDRQRSLNVHSDQLQGNESQSFFWERNKFVFLLFGLYPVAPVAATFLKWNPVVGTIFFIISFLIHGIFLISSLLFTNSFFPEITLVFLKYFDVLNQFAILKCFFYKKYSDELIDYFLLPDPFILALAIIETFLTTISSGTNDFHQYQWSFSVIGISILRSFDFGGSIILLDYLY